MLAAVKNMAEKESPSGVMLIVLATFISSSEKVEELQVVNCWWFQ